MTPYTLGPPRKWHETIGIVLSHSRRDLESRHTRFTRRIFLLQQQDTHTSQASIILCRAINLRWSLALPCLRSILPPKTICNTMIW